MITMSSRFSTCRMCRDVGAAGRVEGEAQKYVNDISYLASGMPILRLLDDMKTEIAKPAISSNGS